MSARQLSELMGISARLAEENRVRFREWNVPFNTSNAKPAILTFRGDVYEGLGADDFSAADMRYAQRHLRILSGLYGVLRPLDLIQPYRLEMGTKLASRRGRDLYAFWGERITDALNAVLADQAGSPLLLNLADPSPDLGWRCLERKAITGRGRPQLTLCLALIHHMVIGSNVPVSEFLQWLADLQSALVIEFITKDDPMVKVLLRNKEDQYQDYELDHFERCLRFLFEVERREVVPSGTRFLYFAAPKASPGS